MSSVEAKVVEVAIAQVKGFFAPSAAERAAAYELLVELTTRPSSAQLAAVDATIGEELQSVEEMFEITREILRKHGTDSSKGSAGNLSLAVIALRVLNEVFRPVINRWRPLLDDHMTRQPAAESAMTAAEWERRWERSQQCRTELNGMRASTRAYIETLSHIAGTTAIADAILSEPSSTAFPRTRIGASLHPTSMDDVAPRSKMVSWLDPVEMWQTWRAGFRANDSLKQANARAAVVEVDEDGQLRPTASFPAVADTDFWFDYVADMGDAFDGTAPVAWLLGRRSISLPDHRSNEIPTPPASMPRGELLVFGGDEMYPFAKAGGYEAQTELPYRMGLEAERSDISPDVDSTSPTLISIPGNHDWLGGIEHYEKMFVSERVFAGHWQTVQRNNWWHVELPQGWWLWGIDTGLHNGLVGPQEGYFQQAAESLRPGDRVILCTPVPLWQLRQKFPEDYAALRATFDPLISGAGATMPLCLSGDTHFFAHLERVDIDKPEDHVTSGGGGAFLQPTHNIPERVPLEQGNAEFKLTSRWPLSADSRAIAPGAKRLFSAQYLPLMVFAALAFAGYAALERLPLHPRWLVNRWCPADGCSVSLISERPAITGWSEKNVKWPTPLSWTQTLSWGLSSLLGTALLILIAWSGTLAFRGNSVEPKLSKAARVYGFVGGGVISVTFLFVNTTRLYLLGDASPWRLAFGWIGAVVIAGVVSIGLFLAVVRWANRKISVNDSLAFLPAQSTRFKNFIRFRIDGDGDLTCYVVGVDPVGAGWYEAMTPSGAAPGSLPPYDPEGSPRLHYIWGRTYEKFDPTPVRLALSISDTDQTKDEPLVDAFEHLGGALLDGGHSIMFGGMPGRGYTERLHHIDRERHSNNPNAEAHLFNYVADTFWNDAEAEAVRGQMHTIRVSRPASEEGADVALTSVDPVIADLSAMRRLMTDHADIRVVVGGALQPGEPGTRLAPGVVEEAFLAVEAGLPLVVAGGFGGAAGLIADALMGRLDPQRVADLAAHFAAPESPGGSASFEEMLTRFRSTGVLRNGLTDGENIELLRSRHALTVTSLILRSVHRVDARSTS